MIIWLLILLVIVVNVFDIIKDIIKIIGLIIILFVVIRQSTVFSKMINTQQVDPEFYKFSNYSSVLIFFQLMLIFSYLQSKTGASMPCQEKK